MDIKLEEIKKIISSPIVVALTMIFILFNVFVIYEKSYMKKDLLIINNIIEEFGYEIDDSMLNSMNIKYKKDLDKFNEMTIDKFEKTYDTVADFIDSNEYFLNYYDESKFTAEEFKLIDEVNLLEIYYKSSKDLVNSYENIDIMGNASSSIKKYGLSKGAAEIVYKNYEKLSDKFDEIVENNEHKNLFFLGKFYETHTLLFRNIFSKMIYEIMILVVLITAYLINYEFDNKTSLLVYSSKRGRNNNKDKLAICIFSAIIISLIIIGITLFVYFTTFDYSEVYKVPISSVFNLEYDFPYISWFNASFIVQTTLCIMLTVMISVILSCIAYIISMLVKNSYIVFFIFFIVFGVFMLIPSLISKDSSLFIYSHYNIFNLILNPHVWFIGFGQLAMSKYYELIIITICGILSGLGCILVFKKFKGEDLR